MLSVLQALCPKEDPWLEYRSQDAGDRALGQAEALEVRLPNQSGYSVLAFFPLPLSHQGSHNSIREVLLSARKLKTLLSFWASTSPK